jgi:hypothetical protein
VLLALLGELGRRLDPDGGAAAGRSVTVPMRLPPHLEDEVDEAEYPVKRPLAPLESVGASPRDAEAMVDCVTDGPPQHAVANVVMVALLERLLRATATGRR